MPSNSPKIIRIDPRHVKVPESVIVSRLGFKGATKIPCEFKETYNKAFNMVVENSKPFAIVKMVPCRWNESLEILGKKLVGKLVERHLKGCEKVTLLLVTLGGKIDSLIEDAHNEGDELLSFFLDAIASEFTEYTVREVDRMLKNEETEYVAGARVSPGYVDLPLQLNQWILDVLDGERFGINVKEDSYVFIPRKTVSALIGWRRKT
ncbi:MAG TPA: methionine synthase [Thermoplasmatales archaeon]|nr:methionine synthase [Thermoplasmatales archaeon]